MAFQTKTKISRSNDPLTVYKYGTKTASSETFSVLSAQAMNAAEASRTVEVDTKNVSKLILELVFTRNSGTDVQIAAQGSLNGGTTYGRITSADISAGTGAVSQYTDVRTTSSTETFCAEYDCRGYDAFKFIFTVTSAAAADTLTVHITGVKGQ